MVNPEGPSLSDVVSLENVSKRYGSKWALSGVDIRLGAGEVIGFVGPNGAGKTTLLKLIMGLARPTTGGGTVLGERFGPGRRVSPHVGIMVERPPFIDHLSGRANLRQLAAIRGAVSHKDIDEAIASSGLDPADRRHVSAYSQGMRQRLAFAQAIMERPPLLLLDEPTNGLDPHGIVQLREAIRAIADEGVAVLLASHLLSEVEAVCDRVMLVEGGQVRRTFDRGSAAEAGANLVRLVLEGAVDPWALRECGLEIESAEGPVLTVRSARPVPDVVAALVQSGQRVMEIGPVRVSLEDVYLDEFRGRAS